MATAKLDVLTALDSAKTQVYHFTAIVIAGMGFFTDAYDLFCISTVTKLLGRLYYYNPSTGKPGTLPALVNSSVITVALVGTLTGQLFFGWLGDKLGRKKVYGITLLLMILCSIASGLSFGSTAKSVIVTLCFFRFWLGFGIGGDYPLSATIMSEYANTRTRGAFIAAVFAMQGFGILTGAAVAIIAAAAFKKEYPRKPFDEDPIGSTAPQADFLWRIILMLGSIPAMLTYYWRMRMPETARYTALVAGDTRQATKDMATVLNIDLDDEVKPEAHKSPQYKLFSRQFLRRHGTQLLGTASTWFLLDIAFYSGNLSQKDVFTSVGWLPPASTMSAIEEVYRIARAQALIALCATVPGYWFTVFLIDHIGRFVIQLQGFFFMTAFMLALAIPYNHWRGENCDTSASKICGGHHIAFVVLYSFTFFFSNFGPNSTTFIVPAELFPARLRSTCHGISAAAGKAGAILGALGFQLLAEDPNKKYDDFGYSPGIGLKKTLLIMAGCNGLGFLFT
eukprot:c26824_g2_i1 orf=1-1521(-)